MVSQLLQLNALLSRRAEMSGHQPGQKFKLLTSRCYLYSSAEVHKQRHALALSKTLESGKRSGRCSTCKTEVLLMIGDGTHYCCGTMRGSCHEDV